MLLTAPAYALIESDLDLADDIRDAHAEIAAEYWGEVHRYGDAWPGAQAQLEAATNHASWVLRLGELLATLEPAHPAPVHDPLEVF